MAVASISAGAHAADKPAELSATELAALQSQQYSVESKVAFGAALSTLQTLGYLDINASKDAGTISAITETKGKAFYNIIWGLGKKKYTQKASLLIEDHGQGSMVRLNLYLNETKSRGIFGTSFSDGKLIKYGGPYREFFAALDAEVKRRGGSAQTMPTKPAIDAAGEINLGNGVSLVPASTTSGYCIKAAAGYVGTGSATMPAVTDAQPICA